MARAKKTGAARFNLPRALYLADNYMRMADRAVQDISALDTREATGDNSGPVSLAISSFAFAIEIYFKSIVYAAEEKTLTGHDLEGLWNMLPDVAGRWLGENFDQNYKSTGKDWSVLILFSPLRAGLSDQVKVTTPGAAARDIVHGHRRAFEVGRYAYELPPSPKLKPILHNVPGLQLLAWLARGLAYHFFNQREILAGMKSEDRGRRTAKFSLPKGSMARFPND